MSSRPDRETGQSSEPGRESRAAPKFSLPDPASPSSDGIHSLLGELHHHQAELAARTQQLEESEQRYRRLLDAVTDYTYRVHVSDGQPADTVHSPGCEAVTGYSAEEFLSNTLLWISMVPEEDRAVVEQQAAWVLSGQAAPSIEHRIRRKDGAVRWVSNTVLPFHAERGQLAGYDGLVRDVTDRKQAELALQQLNRDLQQRIADQTREVRLLAEAMASLAEGVLITGSLLEWPGPQIVYVNRAMCCITGYGAEELIGQTPRLLQGPLTDSDEIRRIRQELWAGRSVASELINYRKDGSAYHAELFITPMHDTAGEVRSFISIHRDITERKQAAEALRREHELNEMIISTAQNIILLLDMDGRIMRINPFMAEISGWQPAELQGRDWFETVIPARDRERVRSLFRRALQGERTTGNVNPIITRDGRERTIQWFDAPLSSSDGTLQGLVCTGHDITEQKRIESALQKGKAETMAILASLSAHIAVIDPDGCIVAVNPAWERFARENDGVALRCGIGVNYLDVCRTATGDHAEEAADAARGLQAVLVGSAPDFSIEYPCHSATEQRWFLLQATPLRHGSGGAVVSHTNITDRVRAEIQLRGSEERLRAILNTAADAIITIDCSGTIENVNSATEQMFGYTQDELIGRNVSVLMPEPYRSEHNSYIARYLQTGEARIIGAGREAEALHRDGTRFPVSLALSEVDHRGLFTGIIRDLSERRSLQQHVLQASTDEQVRIGQDLHDGLGQELTGLGLMADTLVDFVRDVPEVPAGRATEMVAIAEKLASGLRRSLGQVRALARGLIPVQIDPQGLSSALRDLAAHVSELYGMRCQVANVWSVDVHNSETATHLYRIAQEATTNAVKHGQAQHVTISLAYSDGRIVLQIDDDGTGIDVNPPSGDRQTNLRYRGMGLRIMEYRAWLIGGHLTVQRGDPKGTRVSCTVRVADA